MRSFAEVSQRPMIRWGDLQALVPELPSAEALVLMNLSKTTLHIWLAGPLLERNAAKFSSGGSLVNK